MVATLQALSAQEIRDLVRSAGQRLERQLGLVIVAGIDDPQRSPFLGQRKSLTALS
jgi:hypothetical protein